MQSLRAFLEKGVFAWVDFYFAKTLLGEEKERPSYFLLCYLLYMTRQGHLCIKEEEINLPFALEKQEEEFLKEKIKEGFADLPASICQILLDTDEIATKPVCLFKKNLYLQKNWELESQFLFHIQRLGSKPLEKTEEPPRLNASLNEEQKKAVIQALEFPVSLVTGGPGTGKSFTAIEIIQTFLSSLPEDKRKKAMIQVAAPTGKAAAHLQKNLVGSFPCPISCKTLHSLLGISGRGLFEKQSRTFFADLLLIDEASMLDAALFVKLLSQLKSGGRLVLMGDKEQLPPVESGGFFADLVDFSDRLKIPCTTLKKSLRVEKKELKDLAEALSLGDIDSFLSSSFVKTFSSSRLKEVREEIWHYAKPFFSLSSTLSPREALSFLEQFRILSCMRKGPLGVESLNEMILHRFLQETDDDSFLAVPILIKVNDLATGLVNGDTGLVLAKASSFKNRFFNVCDKAFFPSKENGRELQEIRVSLLPSFDLGYCLSVHKSQGSEYNSVLSIASLGAEVFGKEVIYTAITRAKKQLLFLVEENTLKPLIEKSARKHSGISSR